MGWKVERIAVDAPAAAPAQGPRASEEQLGQRGLSSFRTPTASTWAEIHRRCAIHLGLGNGVATLPHANKIWMLFGFELFERLRSGLGTEVIEVYPFAIIRELLPTCEHKSTENGYRDQLDAVAARTGWQSRSLEMRLKATFQNDVRMGADPDTLGRDLAQQRVEPGPVLAGAQGVDPDQHAIHREKAGADVFLRLLRTATHEGAERRRGGRDWSRRSPPRPPVAIATPPDDSRWSGIGSRDAPPPVMRPPVRTGFAPFRAARRPWGSDADRRRSSALSAINVVNMGHQSTAAAAKSPLRRACPI
jgi:predicted nuclease with RNAse H fold